MNKTSPESFQPVLLNSFDENPAYEPHVLFNIIKEVQKNISAEKYSYENFCCQKQRKYHALALYFSVD